MAVCITEHGALVRVPLERRPTILLLDLVHATYAHLFSIFGEDDRDPADAPGWTILTPDGVAHIDYSGHQYAAISPRIRTSAVVTWAICGPSYPAAAWIHKVLGRPPAITAILS